MRMSNPHSRGHGRPHAAVSQSTAPNCHLIPTAETVCNESLSVHRPWQPGIGYQWPPVIAPSIGRKKRPHVLAVVAAVPRGGPVMRSTSAGVSARWIPGRVTSALVALVLAAAMLVTG